MTPDQKMREQWLPLIRRRNRRERITNKELAAAIRFSGVPRPMWRYVAGRLAGTLRNPVGHPKDTAADKAMPRARALALAVEVNTVEAELALDRKRRRRPRELDGEYALLAAVYAQKASPAPYEEALWRVARSHGWNPETGKGMGPDSLSRQLRRYKKDPSFKSLVPTVDAMKAYLTREREREGRGA